MAVKSYALTTRTRLIDFLKLDSSTLTSQEESVLDRIIDSVTETIESYIGFRVKQTAYTTEEYDTDNSNVLLLKRRPIDSGSTFQLQRRNSSLNEDEWETVSTQYYHVDYDAGIIYGAGNWKFWKSRKGYRVTYTAGVSFDNSATFLSDTTMGDLELATWLMAKDLWNETKRDSDVLRERIGDYEVEYRETADTKINSSALEILNKYASSEVGVQTPYVY